MTHTAGLHFILPLIALGGCAAPFSVDDGKIDDPMKTGEFIFLDQEWNANQRDEFYTTPQGNLIIPYKWFLHLETAESPTPTNTILFRDDTNVEKHRYLKRHATDRNKDGLPVGFTKEEYDTDRWGIEGEQTWLGINCAACHTNELHYQGKKIRIDGAPTMGNYMGFLEDLNRALKATMNNQDKFDRFARKVDAEHDKEELKKDMAAVLAIREGYTKRNNPQPSNTVVDGVWRVEDGYARLDAFGSIFNEAEFAASGLVPGDPEIFSAERNARRRTNAPVSYPFLWGTRWHDWVQWPANAPKVPIARNFTQVVGVFGAMDTNEHGILSAYETSMRLKNLRKLADMIENLRSPLWPAGILGAIDNRKWAEGKELFDDHCEECHEAVKREEPQRQIEVELTHREKEPEACDVEKHKDPGLCTDPVMVRNFLGRKVDTGMLEGRGLIDSLPISKLKGKDEAKATNLLGHYVARGVSDNFGETLRAIIDVIGAVLRGKFTHKDKDKDKEIYKGRPLEGVWATAPYLHNGSVPTLRELLKLPEDRVPVFRVGSREFLPNEVGFKYKESDYTADEINSSSVVDTRIPGNSNMGHVYPTREEKPDGLSPDEIDALVIYQMSL